MYASLILLIYETTNLQFFCKIVVTFDGNTFSNIEM